MPRSNIAGVVLEAAEAEILTPIKIYGNQTYTLSHNFLSAQSGFADTLTNISKNFGIRVKGASPMGVGDITCGNSVITAYDFGLLYTIFTAIVMSRIEFGENPPITAVKGDTTTSVNYIWFGNDLVIYSANANIILPVKSVDVERICSGQKVECKNFCTRGSLTLDRERDSFGVLSEKNELLARVKIPDCVKKSYSKYFGKKEVSDVLTTDWDEGSPLGALISESDVQQECEEALQKYKSLANVAAVVCREDLFVTPTQRYNSTEAFFGTLCYTDKCEVVIAVAEHNGLFTYYPWFLTDAQGSRDPCVDTPDFSQFYDVSEETARILRFAKAVSLRPPSIGQVNDLMFNKIKEAFFDFKLSRLPIKASFGKIVVSEDVLINSIANDSIENLQCLLPVGVIGTNLILLTNRGGLQAVHMTNIDAMHLYDVTEVI